MVVAASSDATKDNARLPKDVDRVALPRISRTLPGNGADALSWSFLPAVFDRENA
jgi:hypothetical protein